MNSQNLWGASRVLGACGLAMVMSCTAAAQALTYRFEDLGKYLKPGDTVWIAAGTNPEEKGRLVDLSLTTLTLMSGDEQVGFKAEDIARISFEYRDSVWNGAGIGAAVALAVPVWYCSRAYESGESCGENIRSLVLFGGLGAAIGMGVDSLVMGRRTAYERRTAASRPRFLPMVVPRDGGAFASLTVQF